MTTAVDRRPPRGTQGGAGPRPVLVAVAHGSRDPRSATTAAALVDVVRRLRPGLDVRPAFLDLSAPRLADVLAGVAGPAVVVPLLLGTAHHARVDVPAAVAAALHRTPGLAVRVGGVLGPDPRLAGAALRRLAEAGAAMDDPYLGVVLGAAGSSHAPANDAVAAVAAAWHRQAPWVGVTPAFAATGPGRPSVADAARRLRATGARRIAVATWFLAPGLLPDRVLAQAAAVGADLVAAPLGADTDVAQVVLDRYDTVAAAAAARALACTS
jgi:sirohydrochlorin ferrochelatase